MRFRLGWLLDSEGMPSEAWGQFRRANALVRARRIRTTKEAAHRIARATDGVYRNSLEGDWSSMSSFGLQPLDVFFFLSQRLRRVPP